MSKLNTKTKRKILTRYTELLVYAGYDISHLFGKPLSYFDYIKIIDLIKKLEIEVEIDKDDYFTI